MKRPMLNRLTFDYLADPMSGCITEQAPYGPDGPSEIPRDYLTVPVGKGCVLLLTEAEYTRGLKRGKTWRRRQARKRSRSAESRLSVGEREELKKSFGSPHFILDR